MAVVVAERTAAIKARFGYCRAPECFSLSPRHKLLWATLQFLERWEPKLLIYRADPIWEEKAVKQSVRQLLVWQGLAQDRIRQQFRAERTALADELAGATTTAEIEEGVERALATHEPHWVDALSDLYLDAGQAIGRKTAEGLEQTVLRKQVVDEELWLEPLREYIRVSAATKVSEIGQTTRKKLRAVLSRLVGEDPRTIAKGIDDLYLEQIIPNRSEVIARTEISNAMGFVNQAAVRATGVDMQKVWLTRRDQRTRPSHRDVHRQKRPLDEPYDVGDSRLMYPGDTSLGAPGTETIQCRCTELYEPAPRRGRGRR